MNRLRVWSLTSFMMMGLACSNKSDFKAEPKSRNALKQAEAQAEVAPLPELSIQPEAEKSYEPEEIRGGDGNLQSPLEPLAVPAPEPEPEPEPLPEALPETVAEPLPPITIELALPSSQIRAGKSPVQALATLSRPVDSKLVWTLEGPAGIDLGTIDSQGLYRSPESAAKDFVVRIVVALATDPTVSASKELTIYPKDQIFLSCKNGPNPLFPISAEVYELDENTKQLPDYASIPDKLRTKVCLDKYDIPLREFTNGFPEFPALFEWFSLHTKTKIIIPKDGEYKFRLSSDDGSNLYIDGQLIIDNDGLHPNQERDGVATLTAGEHEVVLDYYQGPRTFIALELKWIPAGSNADYVTVPTSAFKN